MADAKALAADEASWINPVEGIITSLGGLRVNPVTQEKEFHDGMDIACPVGTSVYAPRDGKVLDAGVSPSYGNYLKLSLTDGYTVLYAHLSSVRVRINDTVFQGQAVAYSGNTGRSTGPHLHYSVFQNGQYVNPKTLVNLPLNDATELALREDTP